MKRTKKTLSHDEIKTLEASELAATAGGADGFPFGILLDNVTLRPGFDLGRPIRDLILDRGIPAPQIVIGS